MGSLSLPIRLGGWSSLVAEIALISSRVCTIHVEEIATAFMKSMRLEACTNHVVETTIAFTKRSIFLAEIALRSSRVCTIQEEEVAKTFNKSMRPEACTNHAVGTTIAFTKRSILIRSDRPSMAIHERDTNLEVKTIAAFMKMIM
jgi:hypothetical protein